MGSIEWEGRSLLGEAIPAYRKRVVYLHQRPALFEGTVLDNLKHPFALQVSSGEAIRQGKGRRHPRNPQSERIISRKNEPRPLRAVRGRRSSPSSDVLNSIRQCSCWTSRPHPSTMQRLEAAVVLLFRWQHEAPRERSFIWVSHDLEQSKRMSGRRLRRNLAESKPSDEMIIHLSYDRVGLAAPAHPH